VSNSDKASLEMMKRRRLSGADSSQAGLPARPYGLKDTRVDHFGRGISIFFGRMLLSRGAIQAQYRLEILP
jgi:hypothetical protein